MTTHNILKLGLKIIPPNENLEIDGIKFCGIAYIVANIDGVNLNNQEYFNGSFIIFKELRRSALEPGEYLLFTSVSGIADDSGWMPIKVEHNEEKIGWIIEIDDKIFSYSFERKEYFFEVNQLAKEIELLNTNIKLEPSSVVYPE